MKKYIILAVVFIAIVLFNLYTPSPFVTVEPAPAQKSTEYRPGYNPDNYKRPVREGNCWRQFTSTDSILVCH